MRRSAIARSAAASTASRGNPCDAGPNAISSRTEEHNPVSCVQGRANTMPHRRAAMWRRPVSRPPTTRGAKPVATSSSVEHPAPVSPVATSTSPATSSSDTSASAGRSAPG